MINIRMPRHFFLYTGSITCKLHFPDIVVQVSDVAHGPIVFDKVLHSRFLSLFLF